jgi:hypothetical protein
MTVDAHHGAGMKIHTSMTSMINASHSESLFSLGTARSAAPWRPTIDDPFAVGGDTSMIDDPFAIDSYTLTVGDDTSTIDGYTLTSVDGYIVPRPAPIW